MSKTVACPTCSAVPTEPCVTPGGYEREFVHVFRIYAAMDAYRAAMDVPDVEGEVWDG